MVGFEVGGQHLNFDRRGRMSVEHPEVARRIKTAYGHEARLTFSVPGARGKACACGFNAFAFTKECPRCGADLREVRVDA